MSDNATTEKSWGTIIALTVFAGAVIFGVWYVITSPAQLDRSIIGLQGFAGVAKQQDQLDVRVFDENSGNNLDSKKYGLRILPLYDPDIFSYESRGKDPDLNKVKTLRAMSQYVFRTKVIRIPTLVVLPKWLDGARRLEKLHPDFLIETKSMRLPYDNSDKVGQAEIRRGDNQFVALQTSNKAPKILSDLPATSTLTLYAPQVITTSSFGVSSCQPLIQTADKEILLAHCYFSVKNRKSGFWLLTDPDIINNHGAGNGDNYQFSLALVKALAKGKPIVLDTTARYLNIKKKTDRKERNRSLADLGRFFVYPFTYFWAALLALMFFTLWHAWRRNGPVIDRENDNAMQASKVTAIAANVAILRGPRKTGNKDVPLAWAYASQRMEALGTEIFGSNRKSGKAGEEQIFTALKRRDGQLSDRLKLARKNLAPHGEVGSLFATLNEFENLIEEARHEFGRPANLSR